MKNLTPTISTFELSRLIHINHNEVMKVCEDASEGWGFTNQKSVVFDRIGDLVVVHHLNKSESAYLLGVLSPDSMAALVKLWDNIDEIIKNNMAKEPAVKKITSFELSKLTGIHHDELLNISECQLENYEDSKIIPTQFNITTMIEFEKIQSISFIIRVSPEHLDDLIEWWYGECD